MGRVKRMHLSEVLLVQRVGDGRMERDHVQMTVGYFTIIMRRVGSTFKL